MPRLARHPDHGADGLAEDEPGKSRLCAKLVRGDDEVDRDRTGLEIREGKGRGTRGLDEAGVVEEVGMACDGREHSGALSVGLAEKGIGGPGDEAICECRVSTERLAEAQQVSLGLGDQGTQRSRVAILWWETGNIENEALEQMCGGIVPVGIGMPVGAHDEGVGESGRVADALGICQVEI